MSESKDQLIKQFAGEVAFGLDIGGTLSKVVYFAPDRPDNKKHADAIHEFITSSKEYGLTGTRDDHFSYHVPLLGGTLHFIKFQTIRMHAFLQLVQEQGFFEHIKTLRCTGGGAHKFEEEFKSIGITLQKVDEMDCLVQGAHFLVKTSQNQCYYIEKSNFSEEMKKIPAHITSSKPYLLVNIGSGISILRVDGPKQYSRVGGSSLGGSTFLALAKLLTKAKSFKEALELTTHGDSTKVDMLVRDIYGGSYEVLGLGSTVVASSLGKMVNVDRKDVSDADLAKACLIMITNNIGSLAHLHVKIEKVDSVVFAGNFMENNEAAKRALAFAMDFWSGGKTKALFFENVGYSGAVGALTSDVVEPLQNLITSPAIIQRSSE